MIDINGFDTFVKVEPVEKGYSKDKKYYIETIDGKQMLLRVSDISELDRKKAEYGMMERVYGLGVLTSEPLGFGLCDGGKSCYSLSGWLGGEDAEKALPRMSETEQYVLGMKAGKILRKIHTLPAPENAEPWEDWFFHKVQGMIDFYNANPIKYENGDMIVRYMQDNRHLLNSRRQTFNHGDYTMANLIIMPDGNIGIIDFIYFNNGCGDPWWDFHPVSWDGEKNAHFFTGIIKGYFNGEPPNEFFDILLYYFAYDVLAGVCGDPKDDNRHMNNIMCWLNRVNDPVPSWYLKDFYIQWIDGVPYRLKAPFDFSFLSKYGKVFKVFDGQGSGNISFGVENGEKK